MRSYTSWIRLGALNQHGRFLYLHTCGVVFVLPSKRVTRIGMQCEEQVVRPLVLWELRRQLVFQIVKMSTHLRDGLLGTLPELFELLADVQHTKPPRGKVFLERLFEEVSCWILNQGLVPTIPCIEDIPGELYPRILDVT